MKFLVYSAASDQSIESQLGMADYSYYFVKKAYMPVLQRCGEVMEIDDPREQVDKIYDAYRGQGEFCVFLSFTPPQKTETRLRCPTICVFAWEYGTLPTEQWGGEERHDWRLVLGSHGFAITHSNFAIATVQNALRPDFPIVSLPAPVWDAMAEARNSGHQKPAAHAFRLKVRGTIFDSHALNWSEIPRHDSKEFISKHVLNRQSDSFTEVEVTGVVYTAVFNPNDGRKNWRDLVSAFCWAFRDISDATLILKLTYRDPVFSFELIFEELQKRLPFKCRVIMLHGFLPDNDYLALIQGTHFTVNSSYGEGQCLPLMEFMSAGKPAIAPNHTAMADYIDEGNAFIVKSSREWTHWPHDPRSLKRTFRYRINWQTLMEGFLESYHVAHHDWPRYLAMSEHAIARLRDHCGEAGIEIRLRRFLELRYQVYRQFDAFFASRETAANQGGRAPADARFVTRLRMLLARRLPPSLKALLRPLLSLWER